MKPCARERRQPLCLEMLELRLLLAADGAAWKAALGADSTGIKGHVELNGQDQVLILRGSGENSTLILDTDQLGARVEQIYIRAVERVTLTGSCNLSFIELEDVHRADLGEVTVNVGVYANDVDKLQVDSPHLFAVIDSENTIIRSSHFEDALLLTSAGQLRLSSPLPVASLSLVSLTAFNQVALDFSVGRLNLVSFTAPPQFVAPYPALSPEPPPGAAASDVPASAAAGASVPAFPAPTADTADGEAPLAAPREIYLGLPTDVSARLPEKLAGLSSPVSLPRATKLAGFIAQAIEGAESPAAAPPTAVKAAAPDLASPVASTPSAAPAALGAVDDAAPDGIKKAAAPAGATSSAHVASHLAPDFGWMRFVRVADGEARGAASQLAEISLDHRAELPGAEREAAARPVSAPAAMSWRPASVAAAEGRLPEFRVPALHEAVRESNGSAAPLEEILPFAALSLRFSAGKGLWPFESYVQPSELKSYLIDQLLAEITPGERSVLLTELSETRPAPFVLV